MIKNTLMSRESKKSFSNDLGFDIKFLTTKNHHFLINNKYGSACFKGSYLTLLTHVVGLSDDGAIDGLYVGVCDGDSEGTDEEVIEGVLVG